MITDFIISNSLEELLGHRSRLGMKSLFVAGGTEINRLGTRVSPGEYIGLSLEGLGLDLICTSDDGITIGSMVSLQQLVESEDVPGYVKESALFAGSRTLRNMATIGGNIASCGDDSYLLPTLIAAKARIHTIDIDDDGKIMREDIPIREFVEHFEDFKGSCIEEVFIKHSERTVMVKRYARTKQRRPDAVIAFGADIEGQDFSDVRIAVGSIGTGVQRLPEIEQSIMSRDLGTSEEKTCQAMVKKEIKPVSDITGSSEYKQYLIAVTIEDMIASVKGGQA